MKVEKDAAKEIQKLASEYCRRKKQLQDAENLLKCYVHKYMDEHDMWREPEDILEIIGQLPQGYLRFSLFEQYYALLEKQDGQINDGNRQEGHTLTM